MSCLFEVIVGALIGGVILAIVGVIPNDGSPWEAWQFVAAVVLGWSVLFVVGRILFRDRRSRAPGVPSEQDERPNG